MAKIIIFNNDTLYAKKHTNYKNEMETLFISESKVIVGGTSNG